MGKPAVLDYRLTRWQRAWLSTEPARQLLLQSSAHSLSLLGVRAHLVALQSVWQHLQALLLLAAWCACVQAVLGLQVFGGLLRRRCALCADDACTAPQPGSQLWSQLPCGRGRACPAPFTCLAVDVEPLATWASYDSMSWASLSVFRLWTRGVRAWALHTRQARPSHALCLCLTNRDGLSSSTPPPPLWATHAPCPSACRECWYRRWCSSRCWWRCWPTQ